jgi:hypothetical protein
MNFFEQELAKIFGAGDVIERPEFSGSCCVGSLGQDLRIKAEFVTCGVSDQYEALRLTVLNRIGGEVDKITVKFRDTMGLKLVPNNPNFAEGIVPHIWIHKDKPEWYAYKPTAEDYTRVRKSVENYLKTFREQDRAKLVYVCAPLRGDVEANIEFARSKAAELFLQGYIPICPHLMFPPVADVNNPAQDKQARQMGLQLVGLCSQVNVYGPEWTDGMWAEIHRAEKMGVPVYTDQTTLGRSSRQKNINKNKDRDGGR